VRLDLALIAGHPGLSRRKARDVIEKGQVHVDGRMVREPGADVRADAAIDWNPGRKALARVRSSLPLLASDEAFLVVDKPAGLLSVPTPGGVDEDTVLARVQDYVRRLRPRDPFVGRVHRLDRDTSGSLLFALSAEARAVLIAQFKAHRITRRYSALVAGEPRSDRGVVDAPLAEVYEGGRRKVARGDEPSSPARTHWEVVERFPGAALLDVTLETGRQHQIRVHLAHIRLPVLGDRVYGGATAASAARRQMLHARVLGFEHPVTGVPVTVESPLPEDFAAVRDHLRKGGGGRARRPPRARR
jgi:23S rRNA pseudouridine1911/1915/1917 synthase